jgi:TIR domain/Pentapeptide repeats (8 copies)
MANEEHVALLRKGVDAWNEWRDQEAPGLKVNLNGADLSGANLSGADLIGATLLDANLLDANLIDAHLSEANLSGADLSGANLSGSDLIGATLSGTDLSGADLIDANLIGATLSGADLIDANLIGATLSGADLSGAALLHTVFGASTLTDVKGLNHCRHDGPSFIDFRTLRNSGPLPTAFLRGAGLPNNLIEYLPSLLTEAIQFYSCFISHSGKDQAFAERLHADLQNKGVRCWFAPHDMPIGAKIIDALDEAIRLRDKVLLILSESAIASDWVEGEVTRALDEERTRKQVVLFPVRIDEAVNLRSLGAFAARPAQHRRLFRLERSRQLPEELRAAHARLARRKRGRALERILPHANPVGA